MMKVYYRKAGTMSPTGTWSSRDLWYRTDGSSERVEYQAFTGIGGWLRSLEYTPADLDQLPIVPEVGSMHAMDPDLVMDEGL